MPVSQYPSASAVAALGMSGGHAIVGFDLADADYRSAFQRYFVQSGYRLADVWGYESNASSRYGAIWEERGAHPEQFTQHAIIRSGFQSVFDQKKNDGYRPVRISGYTVSGTTWYAAIWEKAAGPAWAARHDFNILNLSNHVRQVRNMGYRITDLDAYQTFEPSPNSPGSTTPTWVSRFSSIWVESDGREWTVSGPVHIEAWQSVYDRMHGDGWSLVQVTAFGTPAQIVARWEKGVTFAARHGIDSAGYTAELNLQDSRGLRPASVGAYSDGHGGAAQPRFTPIWRRHGADEVVPPLLTAFLRDYEIPGLSLAVSRGGQLVYATGAGIADKATGERVQTTSRFRIASVSKPITATAVMRLVDQGRLNLGDTVFGTNGLLGFPSHPNDSRVTQITVRHLLQHTAGGWPNDANDPMVSNPSLSAADLISAVVELGTLVHAPGTAFAYSNFGYCVLGRVIEKVTGERYATYVQEHMLTQCGISDMEIAGNTLADRRPGEVVYYGLDGDDPYGLNVARMDSHGGWIATAVDLLRFAVRVDGLPSVPDLLPAAAIQTMTTPSGLPGSNGYASGWSTNTGGNWWHTGILPGTRSFLARTADGFCWAVLANSGRSVDGDRTRDTLSGLDMLMWAIRDTVDFWPSSTAL